MPQPASAQGFFESLFGIAPKRPAAPRPIYLAPAPPPAMSRWGSYYGSPGLSRSSTSRPLIEDDDSDRNARSSGFSGSYRTVCVRSCDGYYFPVSFAVGRGRFYRDADVCRSKCGDQAKLYYMPRNGSPDDMVDLQGKPYTKLKTAFLYRKKYINGCRCRPDASAVSERYRHQLYALNEPDERRQARIEGDVGFLAGISKRKKPAEKIASVDNKTGQAAERDGRDANAKVSSTGKTGAAEAALAKNSAGRFGTLPPAALALISANTNPAIDPADASGATATGTRSETASVNRREASHPSGKVYRLRPRHPQFRGARQRPRYVRRQAPPSQPWGLGGKPKYRWPGD